MLRSALVHPVACNSFSNQLYRARPIVQRYFGNTIYPRRFPPLPLSLDVAYRLYARQLLYEHFSLDHFDGLSTLRVSSTRERLFESAIDRPSYMHDRVDVRSIERSFDEESSMSRRFAPEIASGPPLDSPKIFFLSFAR